VAKVKERTSVNKQGPHRLHTERFKLKKLNKVGRVKRSIALKSQIGLQRLKIWKLRWNLIVPRIRLERI
jgi:hypothetical protein